MRRRATWNFPVTVELSRPQSYLLSWEPMPFLIRAHPLGLGVARQLVFSFLPAPLQSTQSNHPRKTGPGNGAHQHLVYSGPHLQVTAITLHNQDGARCQLGAGARHGHRFHHVWLAENCFTACARRAFDILPKCIQDPAIRIRHVCGGSRRFVFETRTQPP